MDQNLFIKKCKELVSEYTRSHIDETIKPEDVYVVWYAKTLENCKALLGTPLPDGMYYEATYSGALDTLFFDAYEKVTNTIVPIEGGFNVDVPNR